MSVKKTLRTCSKGHQYYKTSECPTCPICENGNIPAEAFLAAISAPAKRALQGMGIKSLQQLSTYTEKDLLKAHGIGPASLPNLKKALAEAGFGFKEK